MNIIKRKSELQTEWSEIMAELNKCNECLKNKNNLILAYEEIKKQNNIAFENSLYSSIILDPTHANNILDKKINNLKNGLDYKKCSLHSEKDLKIGSLVSQIIDFSKIIDNYNKKQQ